MTTTETVRQAYSTAWDQVTPPDDVELVREQAQIEFDRWLAGVKAQAWAEGHAEGALGENHHNNPYKEEA